MKKGAVIGAVIAGALFLYGCREAPAPEAQADNTRPPERIICGSPSITEIVFALGCGERVVGVSDFALHPPEAGEKARIGGWINPNRERIIALEPDLILSQGQHESLAAIGRARGIPFKSFSLDRLVDILEAVEEIAVLLGVPEQGLNVRAQMERELRAIKESIRDRDSPSVVVLFGRIPGTLSGLSTIGPDTYLHEILSYAGGSNIFADAPGAFPIISKEALLARDPAVILELQPGTDNPAVLRALREDWKAFRTLQAVRDDRIHYLTEDYMLIPGPRMIDAARRLAQALYPEILFE